jgi:hypothetical protein
LGLYRWNYFNNGPIGRVGAAMGSVPSHTRSREQ